MKVQYTPKIQILDAHGLNEPLERMNGFRPLPIFQETLLVVTGKDEELGFTLKSGLNLVKEKYFSENFVLSNFIGQKPIAIFIEKKGLVQLSDQSEIYKIIDKVLSDNPKMVDDYKNGKDKLFGFFIGQVMKISKGKANPKLVNELLVKRLKE